MTYLDLKLFSEIYKWSDYYQKDGRSYTPSNKKLSDTLKVDYETIAKSIMDLKKMGLINVTQDEHGFRKLSIAI